MQSQDRPSTSTASLSRSMCTANSQSNAIDRRVRSPRLGLAPLPFLALGHRGRSGREKHRVTDHCDSRQQNDKLGEPSDPLPQKNKPPY
jgi:hypothetical protein